MVAKVTTEKVTEVPKESSPEDDQLVQWFYSTPCAGVTYYSFGKRPARPATVEPRASRDTKAGIP